VAHFNELGVLDGTSSSRAQTNTIITSVSHCRSGCSIATGSGSLTPEVAAEVLN
jgi:hypothetical protein